MDKASFVDHAPGQLTKISETDWSFIPAPLPPPNWTIPSDLVPLLTKAWQQIGRLDGLGYDPPNPDILLRPLQDREALRSSSLEGTFATPEELLFLELEEESDSGEPNSSTQEVANYSRALRHGLHSSLPLSLRLIREMHAILMTGVRGDDKQPGNFRTGQVHIGRGRRFTPPPVVQVAPCLDAFEKYLHAADGMDGLVRCYFAHYQFETIHPFSDGNGRVGRLLLALMTQQACEMQKPWLYMSAYFDRHKDDYIDGLFNVSAKADWNGWLRFCLEGTIEQADDTMKRCKLLLELRRKFKELVASTKGSVRLGNIVDRLFAAPIVQIPDLAKRFSVSYPTAKSDVELLVNLGILTEHKRERPKAFFSPQILSIAFSDDPTKPA